MEECPDDDNDNDDSDSQDGYYGAMEKVCTIRKLLPGQDWYKADKIKYRTVKAGQYETSILRHRVQAIKHININDTSSAIRDFLKFVVNKEGVTTWKGLKKIQIMENIDEKTKLIRSLLNWDNIVHDESTKDEVVRCVEERRPIFGKRARVSVRASGCLGHAALPKGNKLETLEYVAGPVSANDFAGGKEGFVIVGMRRDPSLFKRHRDHLGPFFIRVADEKGLKCLKVNRLYHTKCNLKYKPINRQSWLLSLHTS